ncbi:MAG: peroxidase family protein, partial [Actinomycetota bacterium]
KVGDDMKDSRQCRDRGPLLVGGAVALGAATWIAERRRQGRGGYRTTLPWWLYDRGAQALDHRYGWDTLPRPVGFLVLVGLRNILRRQNLHDTNDQLALRPPDPEWNPALAVSRSPDGTYNDLESPLMGMARTRFGRNVPIDETWTEGEPDLLSPNPRTVSLQLLARGDRAFKPASTVNVLAAAWIQFMVKDWFSHGEGDPNRSWTLPVADDDPWPQRPFTILKTREDPTRDPQSKLPATFVNTSTHWWDGSQIYGSSIEEQQMRRTPDDTGKLRIGADGLLVMPSEDKHNPALVPGWWLGLNVMATVFVREHNAVCDRLRAEYPSMSGDELFGRARLVVTALMAKIHTTEWTTAIIAHPTTILGLRSEWWGVLGERFSRAFGRVSGDEVLSGIPGSPTDHYGVPFSITEEFSIVYRMHPLIPDEYVFRSPAGDKQPVRRSLRELSGPAAQAFTRQVPMRDIIYSFGTSHPGALELHNFPNGLTQFQRPDNETLMDLAAIDVLRARELGVPRYNRFRRLLHMKPVRSFEELTGGDKELADEIRRVYDGDLERVDVMVGMFAEPRPAGFAFSDTAFRIFLLMAARRLNSDRFLTGDFTANVYTPVGLEWVQNNTMVTVLLRHYPELAPSLRDRENAFAPWAGTATANGGMA